MGAVATAPGGGSASTSPRLLPATPLTAAMKHVSIHFKQRTSLRNLCFCDIFAWSSPICADHPSPTLPMIHGAAPRPRRPAPSDAAASSRVADAAAPITSIIDIPVDILRVIVTQSTVHHRHASCSFSFNLFDNVLQPSHRDITILPRVTPRCPIFTRLAACDVSSGSAIP